MNITDCLPKIIQLKRAGMNMDKNRPLADRIRPQTVDDMVGQKHLIGKGKALRNIIDSGIIPNMIFFGPSGTGKTTLARIIAKSTDKKLYKLNGTSAGTGDIKAVISSLGGIDSMNGVLLYLDEIQYLNKKQQQSLLEFIEDGSITLIASTTENPYFYIYNAILSRSVVFEFKPVSADEIIPAVKRAFDLLQQENNDIKIIVSEDIIKHIEYSCGGDVRKAVGAVELCFLSTNIKDNICEITLDTAKQVSQRSSMRYDRDGDQHYDLMSAFQKSMRGSDPDAAIHYLARLIEAGDLPSICRRLMVCACEDMGLAYPMGISIVKACIDAALQVGLPEARIPLADAVILVSTAPKSNSGNAAVDKALADIRAGKTGDVPIHLKDSHYKGAQKLGRGIDYKYAQNYENHWVKQQYLPDEIKNAKYYEYGDNKVEQAAKKYWDAIKGE